MSVLSKRNSGTPPGGCLADNVRLVTGTWSATLALDPHDPYFFDHPLDHVPAMALVGGLLDLVRSSGAGHPDRSGLQMTASFELPSCCGLGPAVQLEAIRPQGGTTVAVRARQSGRIVCDGELTFRLASPRPVHSGARQAYALPVAPAMVQRRRTENVLITGMAGSEGVRTAMVRRPPPGHRLAAAPGRPLHAEAFIDAASQFGTMIIQLEHGKAPQTQLVLLGIQAVLPCGPLSDIHLRWNWTPPPRGRSRMVIELVTGTPDGEPSGSVSFDYFTASPTAYGWLRGRERVAA